jgi:hypothetical protein
VKFNVNDRVRVTDAGFYTSLAVGDRGIVIRTGGSAERLLYYVLIVGKNCGRDRIDPEYVMYGHELELVEGQNEV